MKKVVRVNALLFLMVIAPVLQAQQVDLNTLLMESTFKISAPGSTGTAFILGKPSLKNPAKAYYVLITAAHVLEQSQGDKATLFLRKKVNDDFIKTPHSIVIRLNGKQLWTKHPSADVAVMYVTVQKDIEIPLISTDVLFTDEMLERYEIHPGDELLCLGYPLGVEGNDAGFPILRSGKIASYPLTPTSKVKKFLFDFNVFVGNSGGPVYLVETGRAFAGAMHTNTIQLIAGLVTEQFQVEEEMKSLNETRKQKYPLGLGVVIHASLIKEAIDALPSKDN